MQGTVIDRSFKKADYIQLKSKERSITAMKFVKFEQNANESFEGQGFKRYFEMLQVVTKAASG